MRILCLGTSYRLADLAMREKVSFDAASIPRALADLHARWPAAEFAIVSTCNRIEIYTAGDHDQPRQDDLCRWLGGFHRLQQPDISDRLYALTDREAAAHLFKVASGLDSMVVGEHQIVAQVKEAYAQATAAGTVAAALNDLFQEALHVAKHVRSQTPVARGEPSVASMAVRHVARRHKTLRGKCVLAIGAGQMSRLMLLGVAKLRPTRVLVCNRTIAGARRLAAQLRRAVADTKPPWRAEIAVIPFPRLAGSLWQADVVLTSTASARPIITAEMVEAAQKRRRHRPMHIVDIAVPRDVEPAAGRVKNVTLINIDRLKGQARSAARLLRGATAAAEKIIERHAADFIANLNMRQVAPTIEALYRRMEEVAGEELSEARHKLAAHSDADADIAVVRRALHRTVRRILHPLARNLRQGAGAETARAHLTAVRRLFEMED
ncbi:MAG: glutamyl-tRNA reductase [Phycisphaerae bacterium]